MNILAIYMRTGSELFQIFALTRPKMRGYFQPVILNEVKDPFLSFCK